MIAIEIAVLQTIWNRVFLIGLLKLTKNYYNHLIFWRNYMQCEQDWNNMLK